MNRRIRKTIDEPNMSDRTLLITVEDLISRAFGTAAKNTINFKLVQTVLHILARQLRLLEQDVEIKFDELGIDFETGRSYSSASQIRRNVDAEKYRDDYYDKDDYDASSYSSGYSRGKEADGRGARKERGKIGGKRDRSEKEEKEERSEKEKKKEKTEKHENYEKEKRDRFKDKGRESKDRGTSSSPKRRRSVDEGAEQAGRGGQHRRGEHDKDEGGERGSPGRQHGGPKRQGKDNKDEGGERDGPGRQHGGPKRQGKDNKDEGGERDGPGRQHGGPKRQGKDNKDEGGERDGPGRQHGGPKRQGQDDKDEGGERDGPGRQHGGPKRQGQDDKDKGGERDVHGRQHGGQRRRGEDDGDERDEREGRRHGGQRTKGEDDGDERDEREGRRHGGQRRKGEDDGDERDEREGRRHGGQSRDREDRDGERRGDRHEERRGDRRGEKGGEYDEYDDQGRHRLGGREGSGTSITVTEAARKGGTGATDKVLVAERGPAKQSRVARVGSIEVVTASQFSLLERAVRQLEHVTGPLPVPVLPDNKQLRADLATGRASLSDTMEAVQLNKRVQAAEEGLSRMAGLLTQLTAAGALPSDFASRIGDLRAELRKSTLAGQEATEAAGRRGFAFSPGPATGAESTEDAEGDEAGEGAGADQAGGPGPKTAGDGGRSTAGGSGGGPAAEPAPPDYAELPVTHNEMHNILEQMKDALTKEIQNMTARANHSADMASNTSRNVSEKLNIALTLDERITTLYAQTADYTEQLHGFDTGLTTQMASFQEQMSMMRSDLQGGLELLESANNNAETTAILDLSERYQTLVIELDNTVHLHSNLSLVQHQIGTELKSLVECVEMLREQKADRDEVLDGLRDKADITRLAGLLYEKDFAQARFEIEKRIQKSYEKFNKQDEVWQIAMRDLTRITEHKAELIALMALRDQATKQLNGIQAKMRQLEIMLGEPQAALLTRTLAAGAACGACLTRALMPLEDATHGKPALLPALRPAPPDAELPCLGEIVLRPPDTRNHICHRWVGGSHTLMAGNVLRERAEQSHLDTTPFKKYEGYGSDGRLYMMEEEMQPCGECNKFSTDEAGTPPHSPTPTGAGDQKAAPRTNEP